MKYINCITDIIQIRNWLISTQFNFTW